MEHSSGVPLASVPQWAIDPFVPPYPAEPACFLLGYEDIVARIQTLNIWSGVSPKFNCNAATGHLRKITGLSSTDSDPSLHPILRRPEARP